MTLRKRWLWVIGVVIAAILLTFYVYHLPAPTLAVPVPNPNGYDDFVAAINMRTNFSADVPWPKQTNFSLVSAEQYLKECRPALDRLRVGLSKKTAVPIILTTNWIDEQTEILPQTKKLENTLILQGYVAEQQNRFHDAASCYLDGLRFASAVGRGGLLINAMISIANENIALNAFDSLVSKLDAADCRFVLSELQLWKTNREPFEQVAERERKWADAYGRLVMGGLRLTIYNVLEMMRARSLHPEAAVVAKTKAKHAAVADRVEALKVRVAARAFELEHKTAPKNWADLVPTYLPAVPTNSATGKPLTHQFSE